MKIIYINQIFVDRSYITSRLGLLDELMRKGHQVNFILCGRKKDTTHGNYRKYMRFIRPWFNRASLFQMHVLFLLPFWLWKSKSLVIVDSYSVWSTVFALIATRIKLINACFVLHLTSALPGNESRYNWKRFCLSTRFANRFYDGVSFITHTLQDYLEKKLDTKFNLPVAYRPSGIPETLKNGSNGLRQKLGLTNKKIIFYHGSINDTRGVRELIGAMNILEKSFSNIVLFILSSAQRKKSVQKWAADYNVQDLIYFHDSVPHKEVANYISMADICVIPLPDFLHWSYSVPIKLLEYVLLEKPIVLSNIVAHTKILDKDKAVFVDEVSPESLASGIIKSISQKDYYRSKIVDSKIDIIKHYSWQAISKQYEQYLLQIFYKKNNKSLKGKLYLDENKC